MKDVLWRSHRIGTYLDLVRAMNQMTAEVAEAHVGVVYDPGKMQFESSLRLSLVRKTLTDGSSVYDLLLVED